MHVLTRVTFEAATADEVRDLARRSAAIFKRQPGLRFFRQLAAKDTIFTVMEWESPADHDRCQGDPEWGPLFPRWQELQQGKQITFAMDFCEPL